MLASVATLGDQVDRWERLQLVLRTLPLTAPIDSYYISSSFGARMDPFNGERAVHEGLDMVGKPWTFSDDNRLYRSLVIPVTLLIGVLAPLWSFPALLKVILIMGVNVLVVPLVVATLIYLLNRRAVMGQYTAGPVRNVLLVLCLCLAVVLAAVQFPEYAAMVTASSR